MFLKKEGITTKEQLKSWKTEIWSIPNLLSYLRLAMIPFICLLYKNQEYLGTAILVVFSGITDLLDGYIARHYDMITDLGKIVDPIADKLTQLALVLLLLDRYPWFLSLVILLVTKELAMGVMGLVVVKTKKEVYGAIWCGKLATTVFYVVMVALLFFPNLPETIVSALVVFCMSMLILSLVVYTIHNFRLLQMHKENGEE